MLMLIVVFVLVEVVVFVIVVDVVVAVVVDEANLQKKVVFFGLF